MDIVKTVKIKFSKEELQIIDKAWAIFDNITQTGNLASQHDVDAGKICEAITEFLEKYDADWEG